MLASLSSRVGRLVLLTLVLAALTAVATSFAPTIRGFDWVGPIRVLRQVSLRHNFPTVVAVAWILGRLTHISRGELRPRLSAFRVGLSDLLRDPWRWHGLAVGVTAGVIAHVANPPYSTLDIAAVALLAAVAATTPKTAEQRKTVATETLRVAVMFVSTSYVFTVIKAFLFVFTVPRDAAIVAFETSLFGRPVHHWVVDWVMANPHLADVLDEIYYMLFEHMTVAFVFLGTAGLHAERVKLWSSLTICYLIGGPAYYLLPGLGPAFLEIERYAPLAHRGLISRGMWELLKANTNAMRARQPIELSPYDFIACMPSLHLAQETVMLYYARFSRPFFVLSFLFTAATSIAVMALGWHYFSDLFAGVALGAIAIAFVELIGPGLPTLPPSPRAPRSRRPRWVPVSISAGVLAAMWPAWTNPLVFEDFARVLPSFSFGTLRGLGRALMATPISAAYPLESLRSFRPAAIVVDWLAFLFLGVEPRAHRLLSLGLVALCAWLVDDLLQRLEVRPTIRRCAVIAVALHPVSVFAAGYLSARTWLVGCAVILLVGRYLLTHERRVQVVVAAFGGGVALGLLHEGLAFAGMSLPLFASARPPRARVEAGVGATVGCVVASAVRCLVLGVPLRPATGEILAHTIPAAKRVALSLFADANASPSLAVSAGSGVTGLVAGGGLLAVFGTIYLAALWHARTARSRVAAASGMLAALCAVGVAIAGAEQRGVTSAASFPALVGVTIAVATLVDGWRTPSLGVSHGFRRAALILPVVVLVAATPLAWASLLSMNHAEEFAEQLRAAHPDDARVALLAGAALVQGHHPAEGLASCERAAKDLPAIETAFCIALGSAKLGDPGHAVHVLEPSLPILERSGDVRYLYVQALAHSGDRERALVEARRWLARYPSDGPLRQVAKTLAQEPAPTDQRPAPEE
jgi:hypothetical protein